jgi:hypothetical protein
MTCPACGTANTPDSRFCKHCGVALQVLCGRCATANTPDSRFCKACGAPLTQVTPAPPPRATELAIDGALRGKVAEVVKVLGGLNCGRCGYRTCAENALAIVRGEAPPHSCVQGGEEAARQIRAILGQPERPSFGALLWEQLTSIKLAIVLIVAIVVLSIVGTVIPQGKDPLFYAGRYGTAGLNIITSAPARSPLPLVVLPHSLNSISPQHRSMRAQEISCLLGAFAQARRGSLR